ncbi:hypothetical protein JW899_05520 [Candidatus Uhrbacteria bacterium]|nr:hypothetical protein [Candidatus Uhrbacteria bacterium]
MVQQQDVAEISDRSIVRDDGTVRYVNTFGPVEDVPNGGFMKDAEDEIGE